MLTRLELQRSASQTGFPVDSLEKVSVLVQLLNAMVAHPFLGPRVALKGGTALNLFIFDLPRLSVDIDINYIGAVDPQTMLGERPQIEIALAQVASRLGLTVRHAPNAHAGGKWRLAYQSALGRTGTIEVDINFLLRVPLWDISPRDSSRFLGEQARAIPLLDPHELAAGKLAALLARGASRDVFDARELLSHGAFDSKKLRIGFVVYGGINRVDWRTVTPSSVTTTVKDVRQQLLPMLRQDIRPAEGNIGEWTADLVDQTQTLLQAVLPLTDHELQFLEHLNARGVIVTELLTPDRSLQARIESNPALQWKASNVRQHIAHDR